MAQQPSLSIDKEPNATGRLLTVTAYCLLAAWLGAAVFFSFAVAPAAFGVLRGAQLAAADELAGSIVARVLAIINVSGFIVALMSWAGVWLARRKFLSLESALIALVALTTGEAVDY